MGSIRSRKEYSNCKIWLFEVNIEIRLLAKNIRIQWAWALVKMDAGLVTENNLSIEFPQADGGLLDGGED